MTISTMRMRTLAAGLFVVAGSVACDNGKALDDALSRDLAAAAGASGSLELAPKAATPQMVVSAIEGGPKAVPAPSPRAVKQETKRPVERATARPTVSPAPVETRAAAPVVDQAPISAPAPASAPQIEPPPLPPATQGPTSRQPGTFKTEAEIFRQRPWIRP